MINIVVGNNESVRRAERALEKVRGGFPRALSSAINRTLDGMKTDAARETSQRYFISSGEVKKTLIPKRASVNNLNAALISRGRRRTLADYKLTPTSPKSGRYALKGAVKRAGGLKALSNAFLIKGGAGKYRPFYRAGAGRRDIKPFISPAIPQIIKNDETVQRMQEGATVRFEKRLNHETLRLLRALP